MARRRMIDPSIWSDPIVGSLSDAARILFVALISNADDEGRIDADVRWLKRTVFGFRDTTTAEVDGYLQELTDNLRSVVVYEADGRRYAQLLNWKQFQTINRPTPSRIPPPPAEQSRTTHRAFSESSMSPHGAITEDSFPIEVKGREVKRREEKGDARERAPLPPPAAAELRVVSAPVERRRQAEEANELYEAVLDVCGLDRNCSDSAWKDVGRVVGAFSAKGRDGPFVRRQAAWFADEHWKGRQGELPAPKDLLDTAVQFERGVKRKKADNGFTTRSDRNLANLAEIAEHFGLSEIAGNGGGDHEGGHLLGSGDPVEVGAVGDGRSLARGHRQADRAD